MDNQNEKEDIWFTATGEEDGHPLIFRSRILADISESDYPYLITVYWDYESDDESGMPSEEINDLQINFEDALEPLDTAAFSCLVLVITGNGRKEWNWYVSGVEIWMDKFNAALADHPEYPIEIENSYEPDWTFYHNFIAGVKDIEKIAIS